MRQNGIELAKNELTDVAPDWCPVDNISVPNDRINEKCQIGYGDPKYIKASSTIPSLQMPGEGDRYDNKANERESTEDVIGDHGW
jgi:hypothetical protein